MQVYEVAQGSVGEGPARARRSFAGLADALYEKRAVLSPVEMIVEEFEFEESGELRNPPLDLDLQIPNVGVLHVRCGRDGLPAVSFDQAEGWAWELIEQLPWQADDPADRQP